MIDPDSNSNDDLDMIVETSATKMPDKKNCEANVKTASKVPAHFSFGIGIKKTFQRTSYNSKDKYWHQKGKHEKSRKHIESITMDDLTEALPT